MSSSSPNSFKQVAVAVTCQSGNPHARQALSAIRANMPLRTFSKPPASSLLRKLFRQIRNHRTCSRRKQHRHVMRVKNLGALHHHRHVRQTRPHQILPCASRGQQCWQTPRDPFQHPIRKEEEPRAFVAISQRGREALSQTTARTRNSLLEGKLKSNVCTGPYDSLNAANSPALNIGPGNIVRALAALPATSRELRVAGRSADSSPARIAA